MTSLAIWLEDNGLGRYLKAFVDNGIEFEVLGDLTEADLQSMDVLLGDRKRFMRAVARPAEPAAAQPLAAAPAKTQAWRRQLTVLFCDLVASSALAASLDVEDLQHIIRSFQDTCAGVIVRSGGYVARFTGDGLLAYFGYPLVYEDSAEHAVRSGIELVAQIAGLRSVDDEQLHLRVGIATGVVVGKTIGENAAQEEAIVGETPNIAARLQAVAAPDTIFIADSTRRLLGQNFICEDRGLQSLKGLPGQTHVWQVLGERATWTRFEAQQSGHLTPFVGREDEVRYLRELWEKARNGSGQVALLSGEAGIGKSRMCQRFVEAIAETPHFLIQLQCSPQHVDTPFYPMIRHIEYSASFTADDRAETKLDKVQALLGVGGPDKPANLPLYAALLSIPGCGRFPALDLTPQELKERTVDTLIRHVLDLSRVRPVIFIVEDAHWIDPSTLELVERIVDRIPGAQFMMMLTFRPETYVLSLDRPHVHLLRFNRLRREEASGIVASVAGDRALPPEILDQIILKTDGIPMFIEEITKAVLESRTLCEGDDRAVPSDRLQALSIPATLRDSLMARLDRLPAARDVAQIGAAIGREFSYPLLAAVCPPAQQDLASALTQLTAAELVFSRGVIPKSSYMFKHALVQDAAYESLLHSHRRVLHGRIADAVRQQFPEVSETQPQLVAHHLALAGRPSDAVAYLKTAGERALARSAVAEARSLLRRALDLHATIPPGPETRQTARALEGLLGQALIAGSGYAAEETRATLLRARALTDADTPPGEQIATLYGLWAAFYVGSDAAQQHDVGREFMAQAVRHGDRKSLCIAHRARGTTSFTTGAFERALVYLTRARELVDPGLQHRNYSKFGQETGTTVLCYLAMTLWQLGRLREAKAAANEAIQRARDLSDPHTLSYAVAHAVGMIAMFRRDPGDMLPEVCDAIALCEKHGFPFWAAGNRILSGWAMTAQGRLEDGLEAMTAGLLQWQQRSARLWLSFFLAAKAEALAAAGQMPEALREIDRALQLPKETGEHWADPEVLRIKASLLLKRGGERGSHMAETFLRRSVKLALRQGGSSWRLRASCDLAALLRARGESGEGLALLTAAYAGFDAEGDEPDLVRGRDTIEDMRRPIGWSADAGPVQTTT